MLNGPDNQFIGYSERLRRWLAKRRMAVRLFTDAYERAIGSGHTLGLGRAQLAWIEHIRCTGRLFIHVPRTGGTSISTALYGANVSHWSVRYYQHYAPDLLLGMPSVALVRDPVPRFLSAYRYAIGDGTADNRISRPFRRQYLGFRSLDDAINHVARAKSVFDVDQIFRPQSFFLADADGHVPIKQLIAFEEIDKVIATLNPSFHTRGVSLNRSRGIPIVISNDQVTAIHELYKGDLPLLALTCTEPRADPK